MTMILELDPAVERKLQQESERLGMHPEEVARRLITDGLSPMDADRRHRLLATLRSWNEEDATDDPSELAQRETEWEEFRAAINESRRQYGEEPLYP